MTCLQGNPVPSPCDAGGGQETIPRGSSCRVQIPTAKYRTPHAGDDIVQTDGCEPCESTAKAAVLLYAKTGVLYPMPRVISKFGRPLPYFMKYRSPYYARQQLAKAASNMNRLCWDLERWERGVRWKKEGQFDWQLMYDPEVKYTDEQFDAVEKLFLDFCTETTKMQKYQSLVRKYQAKDIREKYTKAEASSYIADWDSMYRRYKELAKEICPDERVLANIGVILTYVKYKSRGKKFPWVVSPSGLIRNIRPKDLMYIPEQSDDGRFTYLGKPYKLSPKLSDDYEINLEPDIFELE